MKKAVQFFSLVLMGLLVFSTIPAQAQQSCNNTMSVPRPVALGTSGSNINSVNNTGCCSGTLGSLVVNSKGHEYILSNNHVLARTSGTTGFPASAGEKIVQPGLADIGCFRDKSTAVAKLSKWVPLSFRVNNTNVLDAAIARVIDGQVDTSGSILGIGPISGTTFPSASLGMVVQKMGRTTCLTNGMIVGLDATGKIVYPKRECRSGANGTANFIHQILVQDSGGAFAAPGDSGSLVLSTESCPRAVGLLFAGSSAGLTVLNPIDKVLSRLKVSMVGGCVTPAISSLLPGETQSASATVAFQSSLANAQTVKDRHEGDLMKLDQVSGAALGISDDPTQAAILVFVVKDTSDIRAQLPTQLEGVQVKVVETGEFHAL